MQGSRNIDILMHIRDYCAEINHTMDTFGRDYDIFVSNSIYQNAVALCVLQIGELTTHFTDEFKSAYNKVPWNQIKALRNVVAHNYGKIDKETLWETLLNDIPDLNDYCCQIITEHQALEQECDESQTMNLS